MIGLIRHYGASRGSRTGFDYARRDKDVTLMRARKLGSALFKLLFALVCAALVVHQTWEWIELSRHGRQVTGTVMDYRLWTHGRFERYESHRHTIEYAGHEKQFDLPEPLAEGTPVTVLYSVREPDVARARTATAPAPLWRYILHSDDDGGWVILLFVGMALAGGYWGTRELLSLRRR
jgi:hypothetical protein